MISMAVCCAARVRLQMATCIRHSGQKAILAVSSLDP